MLHKTGSGAFALLFSPGDSTPGKIVLSTPPCKDLETFTVGQKLSRGRNFHCELIDNELTTLINVRVTSANFETGEGSVCGGRTTNV